MCEIITKIILDGQSYLLPTHPEYEPSRIKDLQDCLMPMSDYLRSVFTETGTIEIGWDDDKKPIIPTLNSPDIQTHRIIEAWNAFQESLPCIGELRSKI